MGLARFAPPGSFAHPCAAIRARLDISPASSAFPMHRFPEQPVAVIKFFTGLFSTYRILS